MSAAGCNDTDVAWLTGLPRTTVRDMRRREPPLRDRCPRCWRTVRRMNFSPGEYAELLGYYLGDGYIVVAGRTQRLRISLDAKHPQLIAELEQLLGQCFPENRVSTCFLDGGVTAVVSLYCSHLGCLFPQTGAGMKHTRTLRFEPWQYELIDAAPWSLLRGLVMSDGCAFINRTGPYRYLSYDFTNESRDILDLFCRTCDRVGVQCRRGRRSVRIYRRESVTLLAAFVGAKR